MALTGKGWERNVVLLERFEVFRKGSLIPAFDPIRFCVTEIDGVEIEMMTG